MSGIFEKMLKTGNKSSNSILRAFLDSGIDVMEELGILVGRIYDYTIKLAEDNNISLTDEERNFSKSKSSDSIINLQSYLRTQKRIFEEVA